MSDSTIVKAEIKYVFSTNEKAKALFTIKYSDGSIKKAEGIQAIEEADRFLEDLKDNPIYVEPPADPTTGTSTTTTPTV